MTKQIDEWNKTAARYRSEPEAGGGKGEGTVELSRRALGMEKDRDLQLNKYHNFELASAAFQIGIVLASATVITGIVTLALQGGLGDRTIGAVVHHHGDLLSDVVHRTTCRGPRSVLRQAAASRITEIA